MEISEYVSSKVSCSLPFGQVGFPAAQLAASQNILPIFCFSQTRYKRYIDNSHLKRHESMGLAHVSAHSKFRSTGGFLYLTERYSSAWTLIGTVLDINQEQI